MIVMMVIVAVAIVRAFDGVLRDLREQPDRDSP
jgi:hypothetical protein